MPRPRSGPDHGLPAGLVRFLCTGELPRGPGLAEAFGFQGQAIRGQLEDLADLWQEHGAALARDWRTDPATAGRRGSWIEDALGLHDEDEGRDLDDEPADPHLDEEEP